MARAGGAPDMKRKFSSSSSQEFDDSKCMRRSGSALTVCGPCRRAWPVPGSGLRVGLSGPEEIDPARVRRRRVLSRGMGCLPDTTPYRCIHQKRIEFVKVDSVLTF
jgi:hypothetical protein